MKEKSKTVSNRPSQTSEKNGTNPQSTAKGVETRTTLYGQASHLEVSKGSNELQDMRTKKKQSSQFERSRKSAQGLETAEQKELENPMGPAVEEDAGMAAGGEWKSPMESADQLLAQVTSANETIEKKAAEETKDPQSTTDPLPGGVSGLLSGIPFNPMMLGLLVLGNGGSGGGSGSSLLTATKTVVSGSVVLGPVVNDSEEETGLEVQLFDEQGKAIGTAAKVGLDGRYTIDLNEIYTGGLVAVLRDRNGNAVNYWNEATGKKSDLSKSIMGVTYAPLGGNISLNLSHLSTLGAYVAGIKIPDGVIADSPERIEFQVSGTNRGVGFSDANQKVGIALGLNQDVTTVELIATITQDGTFNSNSNLAGQIEAALACLSVAGIDLSSLAIEINSNPSQNEILKGKLIKGAQIASTSTSGDELIATEINKHLSKTSSGVSIDAVTGDDKITSSERSIKLYGSLTADRLTEERIGDIGIRILSTTRYSDAEDPSSGMLEVALLTIKVSANGGENRWESVEKLPSTVDFSDDVYLIELTDNERVIASRYVLRDVNPDGPQFIQPQAISLVDTPREDAYRIELGQLDAVDALGQSITFTIKDGEVESNVINGQSYSHKKTSVYGTLYIDKATGRYAFKVNDLAVNQLSDTSALEVQPSVSFNLIASTTNGSLVLTSEKALTINLAGSDDLSILQVSGETTLIETWGDDVLQNLSGRFSVTDIDTTAPYEISIDQGLSTREMIDGKTYHYKKNGLYGTLYLINSSESADHGKCVYVPNSVIINQLKAGEFTDSFIVRGGSGEQEFVVRITGADDLTRLSMSQINVIDTDQNDSFGPQLGYINAQDVDTPSSEIRYGISSGTNLPNPITFRVNGQEFTFQVSHQGRYGILYINTQNGFYAYVANSEQINALASGDEKTDSFDVIAGTGTGVLNIRIFGENDRTQVQTPEILVINDTSSSSETFAIKTGVISAFDAETNRLTYGIESGSDSESVIGGVTYHVSKAGRWGKLYLNTTTGQYAYEANSQAVNDLGANVHEIDAFNLTARVGSDAPGLASLRIEINGADDVTAISVTNIEVLDTSASDSFQAAPPQGQFNATDRETLSAEISFGIEDGAAANYVQGNQTYTIQKAGRYGVLYLQPSTGKYVYVPNDAAVNALAVENKTDVFTITAGSGSTNWTVTIRGADDTTLLSSPSDIQLVDTSVRDALPAASGRLSATDVDSRIQFGIDDSGTSAEIVSISGKTYHVKKAGTYGTLRVNTETGDYLFIPNSSAIDAVGTSNVSESFTVRAGNATKSLTVRVMGANDDTLFTTPVTIQIQDTSSNDV